MGFSHVRPWLTLWAPGGLSKYYGLICFLFRFCFPSIKKVTKVCLGCWVGFPVLGPETLRVRDLLIESWLARDHTAVPAFYAPRSKLVWLPDWLNLVACSGVYGQGVKKRSGNYPLTYHPLQLWRDRLGR